MPLDFADFAHHYEGQSQSEGQKRSQFETLADLLDCIVRMYWSDGARAKELGITLERATLTCGAPVDSADLLTSTFNKAASYQGAGRRGS